MRIISASFSEQGPRVQNQDLILAPREFWDGWWIAAVADGVGGSTGGLEAAQIAVEVVEQYAGPVDNVEEVFNESVQKIRKIGETNAALSRMATTLSVICFNSEHASILHVGDTRIYHIRGSGLNTLTEDQTEVAELKRKGILTDYQVKRYPRKNVLTSVLSAKNGQELYRNATSIQSGDRLLLLSDGAYNKILKRKLVNLSNEHTHLHDYLAAIRSHIESNEPEDNYTALAIEIDSSERS